MLKIVGFFFEVTLDRPELMKHTSHVYEPQPDGSLQLVAVENLVFAAAWHGQSERPPTFHGRTWPLLKDDPRTKLDEAHGWEAHYEQHLWVFRDNPNGAYSPFNPAVTCSHHKPPAAAA